VNDALYIAATGLQAQQLSIDTIANNLANVSTPGFKKGRVNFQEMLYVEAARDVAGSVGTTNPLGLGISVNSVAKDFSVGTLKQTNSPLDVAIDGNGLLEVTLADGSRGYTRGGSLQVTKDSFLATSNGFVLKPAIHIPADITSLVIGEDGKVTVQTASQKQAIEVGQIELVNFSNPSALKALGNGVYVPTDVSGEATYGKPGTQGLGKIAQRTLENANTSLVDEMVTLMVTQRAYELSSKIVQASDEMMSMTNNLRR
jgi:flagellar basal-body rod protein FlgG